MTVSLQLADNKMLITQISPQKHNRKRMNIFLDGKFVFSLDKELLIRLNLKENQFLSRQQVAEILKENELDKWYDRSLRFLSYRPRSKKEILSYLKKNEVGEALTKLIIDKLTKNKLIDDREFAQWLVSQRQGRQARGKKALEWELQQKGIAQEMIEDVLGRQVNEKSEFANALKIAEIKLGKLKRENLQKRKEKLAGFLLRRGFNWEVVNQVLHQFDLIF